MVRAATNPNATSDQLDRGLSDYHEYVREGVARNQNVSKSQLSKLLQDDDEYVKFHATGNPRYKEFFPNGYQ